jgi:hypothetical protein
MKGSVSSQAKSTGLKTGRYENKSEPIGRAELPKVVALSKN